MTAASLRMDMEVVHCFPVPQSVAPELPERPRVYLSQAKESLHAPSGAVMLAASSVDAMLKEKQLVNGSLYARIEEAVTRNLLTAEMSQWAHQVRLDANDQRHADQGAALPSAADAQRCIDFAEALGEILFVLPARVARGLQASNPGNAPTP